MRAIVTLLAFIALGVGYACAVEVATVTRTPTGGLTIDTASAAEIDALWAEHFAPRMAADIAVEVQKQMDDYWANQEIDRLQREIARLRQQLADLIGGP